MIDDTQIVKGILEGCILKIISDEKTYGYKVVEKLNSRGFEVNEATVYPILTRLYNKGFLDYEKKPSPLGPSRKYYFINADGVAVLDNFSAIWEKTRDIVDNILEGSK